MLFSPFSMKKKEISMISTVQIPERSPKQLFFPQLFCHDRTCRFFLTLHDNTSYFSPLLRQLWTCISSYILDKYPSVIYKIQPKCYNRFWKTVMVPLFSVQFLNFSTQSLVVCDSNIDCLDVQFGRYPSVMNSNFCGKFQPMVKILVPFLVK